jgi:hypothetical protein
MGGGCTLMQVYVNAGVDCTKLSFIKLNKEKNFYNIKILVY